MVITSKRTYDAFQGTELEGLLRRRGVDAVIVGGVMTNLCCETTARWCGRGLGGAGPGPHGMSPAMTPRRSAFTKDFEVVFEVVFLRDGNATATEEMQRATLLNIGFGFGRVLSCVEAAELAL